jgi:hypothetical protein
MTSFGTFFRACLMDMPMLKPEKAEAHLNPRVKQLHHFNIAYKLLSLEHWI